MIYETIDETIPETINKTINEILDMWDARDASLEYASTI